MKVSTSIDDYIRENQPIWIADLNDGTSVFQDDFRPGCKEHSAWIRLQKYLTDGKLSIVRLKLKFWSNVIFTQENKKGYYFSKGCSAFMNDNKSYESYNVGFLTDDKQCIIVQEYVLPALLPLRQFNKTYQEAKNSQCLIENPEFC